MKPSRELRALRGALEAAAGDLSDALALAESSATGLDAERMAALAAELDGIERHVGRLLRGLEESWPTVSRRP